ncbi:hypothetical protein BJM32_07000 [Listeria monocytogenes]|uniref:hypothetical protein n=1 Tax=Listeria monocytogenes TaxID=1639 RepID=UPI0008735C27|nr:hypothetical protein [Listeria monocytogenes]EAD7212149.1 hypothetical protein [Listeria monocytogenes]EAD8851636.1 hypothetical protein [Listeria monocytogenes]OFF50995.1 hypothetical protein BJM32_07000 [Listeria monocytogenes]
MSDEMEYIGKILCLNAVIKELNDLDYSNIHDIGINVSDDNIDNNMLINISIPFHVVLEIIKRRFEKDSENNSNKFNNTGENDV